LTQGQDEVLTWVTLTCFQLQPSSSKYGNVGFPGCEHLHFCTITPEKIDLGPPNLARRFTGQGIGPCGTWVTLTYFSTSQRSNLKFLAVAAWPQSGGFFRNSRMHGVNVLNRETKVIISTQKQKLLISKISIGNIVSSVMDNTHGKSQRKSIIIFLKIV
jgi:hypothetical protein